MCCHGKETAGEIRRFRGEKFKDLWPGNHWLWQNKQINNHVMSVNTLKTLNNMGWGKPLKGWQLWYFIYIYTFNIHWKDWCWSWSSKTLATWCKWSTHCKRPWCWERLKAGEGGDDRGCDGWMASLTQWTWIWANSGRWWRTEKPGVLRSMGSQTVGHNWETEQHIKGGN